MTDGGAVLGREGAERVPGDLRVVMAMIVDKAGADRAAVGVDRLRRRAGELADLGDLAVLDPDIAAEGSACRSRRRRRPFLISKSYAIVFLPRSPVRPPRGRLAGTLSRNLAAPTALSRYGLAPSHAKRAHPEGAGNPNRSRSATRRGREDVSQYGVVTDAGARRIRLLMARARQLVHRLQACAADVTWLTISGFAVSRLDMRAGDDRRDTVLRRAALARCRPARPPDRSARADWPCSCRSRRR